MSISTEQLYVRIKVLAITFLLTAMIQSVHFWILSARIQNTQEIVVEILAEKKAQGITVCQGAEK